LLPLPNFEENLHFEFQLGNEIRYDPKPGDFKVHVPKFRISVPPVQVFQEPPVWNPNQSFIGGKWPQFPESGIFCRQYPLFLKNKTA
jgi:hypothetical protein